MAPTSLQFCVMTIVLLSVGLVATVFRLFMRRKARLLAGDDFWAALAGALGILLIGTNILHTSGRSLSEPMRVACYYMCIQSYYAVIWTSRLSILCTIIRLSTGRLRNFLIASSFLFVTSWAVLFAQVFWICESGDTSWKQKGLMPQCTLTADVAIAQIITVVIGDPILVLSPIKVVWGSRLSNIVKIRLTAVFTSTIVTTVTSLVYINALLNTPGITEQYMGTIHAGVSLLVANLAVIVGFIFKFVSSSIDLPGAAYDNTKLPRHDLRLSSHKDSATTLDPSIDAALEVHVKHDTVIDISIQGHDMIKTVDLKSPVGDIDLDADSRSSVHDLNFSDEKV